MLNYYVNSGFPVEIFHTEIKLQKRYLCILLSLDLSKVALTDQWLSIVDHHLLGVFGCANHPICPAQKYRLEKKMCSEVVVLLEVE